ncbi:MAG: response regulator [Clostridia bacterium]
MFDKYTVLIADDEKIDRDAYKMMIARGVPQLSVVGEVDNGIDAVRCCCESKPDIVLMDISMPGLNGMEAIRVLRREHIGTSVVIISAYDYFEHAREALSLGVLGFLVKPVSELELKAEMERVIGILADNRQRMLNNINEIQQTSGTKRADSELQDSLMQALRSGDGMLFQSLTKILDQDLSSGIAVIARIRSTGDAETFFSQLQKRYKNHISFVSRQAQGMYVFLLCEESIQAAKAFLLRLRQTADRYGIDVCFGVGLPYDSASEAGVSLAQAVAAFDAVETISVFDPNGNNTKRLYPIDREIRLISCLQNREEDKSHQILDDIFQDVRGNSPANCFPITKFLMKKLFLSLNRIERGSGTETSKSKLDVEAEQCAFDALTDEASLWKYFSGRVDRLLGAAEAGQDLSGRAKTQPILEFIRENYSRDIPLSQLSQKFYFSQGYLGRLIKETTSLSYTELVMNLRLDKAKTLLRETLLNISEIGDEVGYKDANYFTKVFKKATGLTPQKYRSTTMDGNDKTHEH